MKIPLMISRIGQARAVGLRNSPKAAELDHEPFLIRQSVWYRLDVRISCLPVAGVYRVGLVSQLPGNSIRIQSINP